MNLFVIDGKEYERVLVSRNIGIASACLEGLKKNNYDAVLFVDKIRKETVYRVVVKK